MRIKSIAIRNFRSFKDCTIELNDYTALVGANGAGKSTVLHALNVFFGETDTSTVAVGELGAGDFCEGDTSRPIEITVTFGDLSAEAQEDFRTYFRQGELVIAARAAFEDGKVSVTRHGERQGIAEFATIFESETELREKYERLKTDFPDLPAAVSNAEIRQAVRDYEDARPEMRVPIRSGQEFHGSGKGSGSLEKHVQWIYVPAVKDAGEENVETEDTVLGKILARTVRTKVDFDQEVEKLRDQTLGRYREMLKSHDGALKEISESLTERLGQWAHPGVEARLFWATDRESVQVNVPKAQVRAREGGFEVEIARLGHGLQRSYLLALLQELASAGDDAAAPTLILGCEEPELYQHPPQARHLASVLQELSNGNAQVLVSTHSPHFVSGQYFESLRMVRRDTTMSGSDVSSVEFDKIAERMANLTGDRPSKQSAMIARLEQALQPGLNEMFFASSVVFVEGLEDVAYINTSLVLADKWNEVRRHGAHIIPVDGKNNLLRPLVVAEILGIPAFAIFDGDRISEDKKNAEKNNEDAKEKNKVLLNLLGGDLNDPLPAETVWADRFAMWPDNLRKTLETEIGQEEWTRTRGRAFEILGGSEKNMGKNSMFIGHHLSMLHEEGKFPNTLRRLCDKIVEFASTG